MCEDSDDARHDPVELTEANAPYMIHESTTTALHAATMYSNGWVHAGRGLYQDMVDKWSVGVTLRMAYVWGAALAMLPAPDGDRSAYSTRALAVARQAEVNGERLAPEMLTALTARSDQLDALVSSIATAASEGDLTGVEAALRRVEGPEHYRAVVNALMAGAGIHLRHAADPAADPLHMQMFMAHINADMPVRQDEEGEAGEEAGDDQP